MRYFLALMAGVAASPAQAQNVYLKCTWDYKSSFEIVVDSETMVASVDGGIREYDVIKVSKEAVWLAEQQAYNPSKLTLQMIPRNTSEPVRVQMLTMNSDKSFSQSNSGRCIENPH
ncbi:hypothetical protein [Ruegeria arenilitoris]|uniref:hypothetical protein n=1 Tax=Ruegeria arenilitoris TaxID=1173585 RepID=UPI00147E595B|nr:hypothetical protein [Ruegeria arenilitoris]